MPTTKELVMPVAMVLTLLTSLGSFAVSYGKNEQKAEAVDEIKKALVRIDEKLDKQDGHYLETFKETASLNARMSVLEKAMDTQAGINQRFLGHLETISKGVER